MYVNQIERMFADSYNEHSSKHRDYFDIYDEIFRNVNRFENYKILEIGVDNGSGVRALKNYFPNSKIFGLDILQDCQKYEEENIRIIIGSQIDLNILDYLKQFDFDLIIDDGSHDNNHVFQTFHELFPSLNSEKIGLYIIEDIHTSYWPYYNGGLLNPNSTVERFKKIIDEMHNWCVRDSIDCHVPPYKGSAVPKSYYEAWTRFIQFYENIIVIKKRKDEARCSLPK